jgi:mono/diheme cytochrome c family protein
MKSPTRRRLKLASLTAVVASFAGVAAAKALAPLTFTAQQAAGGRANYAAKCSRCHGSDLEGGVGPALSGGGLDNYLSGSAGALFDFIISTMPQDAPGTLTPDETATVVAYLASKNGRAAGATALPNDTAALAKMGFTQ